jgi:hypothetical protein
MNMRIRQPARRLLGPTKICFNPNVGRELGWKDSVDNTGKLSAVFTGFAKIIFFSWIRIGPVIKEIEAARAGIRRHNCGFVLSTVPIQVVSGGLKTLQRKLRRAVTGCDCPSPD